MTDEIALFIDFENIRYSLINVQHREPDPQELIGVARRYGTVMVARAYADWSRQPEFFKGSLTAAMIDRVDCPAKVRERFRPQPQQSLYAQSNGFDRPQGRDEQDMSADEYDGDQDDNTDDLERDEGLEPRLSNELRDPALEGGIHRAPGYTPDTTGQLARDEDSDADGQEDRLDEEEEYTHRPNGYGYPPSGYVQPNSSYLQGQSGIITQSTVDLNMLMDIIETVFDRPNINTFVLMSGDRDFTRICARLKLRLNKRVIVVGVPGTVSRDLISAAEQFVALGYNSGGLINAPNPSSSYLPRQSNTGPFTGPQNSYIAAQGPVSPDEPGFIQFLDYIDRHWSWRTVGGVANFIGDPFNPKNRFRGRLTRESARDLLRMCIDDHILEVTLDPMNNENLRLNRDHPAVAAVLALNESH